MSKKRLPSSISRVGLVGEWLLDGNRLDTNDGTKNNGTATNVTYVSTDKGYQKQAGSFNGSSSSIMTTYTRSGDTTPFTLTAWIYSNNTTVGTRPIGWSNSNARNSACSMYAFVGGTGNKMSWIIRSVSGTSYDLNHNTVQNANTWEMYTLTYNGSIVNIYKNGVLDGTKTGVSGIGNRVLSFGRSIDNGTPVFNGNIQDARIYNRVLSQDEIQLLYQEGLRQLGQGSDNILSSAVAYYDFNGDANDIIGGNNGTNSGATLTTDRFGIANRAYSFGDDTKYITIPNSSNNTFTGNFTINTVFNLRRFRTNITANESLIVSKGTYPTYNYRIASMANGSDFIGGFNILTYDGNAKILTSSSLNYGPGLYNIAQVVENGILKLYINGILDNTLSGIGTIANNTYNPVFGKFGSGNNYAFDGNIENVSMFNKALSADEVKELYNLSKIKYLYPFKKTFPLNLNDGKVLHLAGDINGTTAYDISGNGNNGTMVNSPTISRVGQHKVFNLNGTNQSITSSYSPNITSPISFSFWYKTSANYSTTSGLIVGKFNTGNNYWIGLNTSNLLTFYVGGSSNWSISDTSVTNDNKWHLGVGVYDGTNIKLYVDGKLKNTIASGTCSPTGDLAFGRFGTVGGYFFNGLLKDIAIHNKALSPLEIQQLYYSTFIS